MLKVNPDGMVVEYIENNLSPKQEERDLISKRYEDLSKMLKGTNFQSGSYARFTAITPVNDLDVIWEVDAVDLEKIPNIHKLQKSIDPVELDISNLLHDLADRLDKEYKQIGQSPRIEPQTHSVGIFFGKTDDEFSIDVVPAVPSGDKNDYGDNIYLVPEIIKLSKSRRSERYNENGNSIKWLRSDPKGYIEDAKKLNEKNDFFRKVAKFIKSWKLSCKNQDDNFPLKSFHLELIVTELFNQNISLGCLEGICLFFEKVEDFLNNPNFQDKADRNKFTDDYILEIDSRGWSLVKRSVSIAKGTVEKIKKATDHSEIDRLVKDLVNMRPNLSSSANMSQQTRIVDAYSKPYSF